MEIRGGRPATVVRASAGKIQNCIGFVDRPQQFLALHFAIGVWDSNIGEVMGHPDTDPAVFEQLLTFADEIGLVPVHHVATLIDEANSHSEALSYARYIDERFIQPGHLGVTSGQGFYSYPNPTFAQPGFI